MQKRQANLWGWWLRRVGLTVACFCVVLLPTTGFGQSIEDTVQFISDMANTHGFVRSLSCRNPKAANIKGL